jgi:hypothetical protein
VDDGPPLVEPAIDAEPAPDPLWDAAAQLTARAEESLEADVRQRVAARNCWGLLARSMRERRISSAAKLLADPRLAEAAALYPQLASSIQRIRLAVQRAIEGQSTALSRSVKEYADGRGWRAETSQDRVVVDGLVVVSMLADGSVKVQSKQVRSLAVPDVLRALESEHDRVWARAEQTRSDFAEEFRAVVQEAGRDADQQGYVRLQDAYSRLKGSRPKGRGRLVSYYRDEFSADLSCVARDPILRRQFQFSAARDPNLAFSVVLDDGTLNQYGYVRLRQGNDDGR